MKVLFIGGTGRLSKDVAQLALERGNDVYLLTRGSSTRKLFVNSEYHMICGDVRDVEKCKQVLQGHEFDVVVDFLSYTLEQLKGTLEIVKGAYKQYIFISTATVYKKKDENEIISEFTTELGNEKWTYALNKYNCEQFLKQYFADRQAEYTIIRPYVTYGNTRVPYPIVPFVEQREWTLVDRIIHEQEIPIFDGGITATTLTHTKDFAKGVVGLFGNEKAYGEDFHITSNEHVVWNDVLECIGKALGCGVNKIDFLQEEIYHCIPAYEGILKGDKGTRMVFDNSKIFEAVEGFHCDIALSDGIKDMIAFYQKHPELQIIDYYWDGEIDRLMAQKGKKNIRKYEFPNKSEQLKYLRGRYVLIGKLFETLKNMKNRKRK